MPGITIISKDTANMFFAPSGANLLDFIRSKGYLIESPCGGKGTCGKCLVIMTDAEGTRTEKACNITLMNNCTVTIPEIKQGGIIESSVNSKANWSLRQGLGAAVDLGTTTVAVRVYDLSDGSLIGSASDWNSQFTYGADVISRVQYCMEKADGLNVLSGLIRDQIRQLINQAAPGKKIDELVIAGNTIMQHIFAAIDPASMATAPYLPETLFDSAYGDFAFPEFPDCKVTLCPCIAGYIGGDIVAGMESLALKDQEELSLFIDIGTNGEMAIGNKDGYICCSVASGPAFEGAAISCGMRSVNGAINHLAFDGELKLSVLGGDSQNPKGLCGSGLVDLLAVLLDQGAVNGSGRLLGQEKTSYLMKRFITNDENGNGIFWLDASRNVSFTAADVRQLQLAKAAVAAGIEILISRAQIQVDDIKHLYIAGGFGKHMDMDNAASIGLIPEELKSKADCIGNSSLDGAVGLLADPSRFDSMLQLQKKCQHIELSLDPEFTDAYIDAMSF